MTMPGRKYSQPNSNYRYGFNGKEKSAEITSDDYDFGARIYDGRLGRWLSVDPLQKKYANWSPYNFVMNSPLKLMDVDGKDIGVSIVGNKIIFSSNIFVVGPGASDIATQANSSMKTLSTAALQNRTYTDNAGKCYEIQFEVHYVAVDPANPKDPNYAAYNETMNAKVGTNQNNVISSELKGSAHLMETNGERTRANAGSSTNLNYNSTLKSMGKNSLGVDQLRREDDVVRATGNLAYVFSEDLRGGSVVVHETFHLFGLGDRYIEGVKYLYKSSAGGKNSSYEVTRNSSYPGFQNDLMSNNLLQKFNQAHIDNFAKAALNIQSATGKNSFVIGQSVDNANNKDKANADTPKGDKTSSFTKLPNQ